MDLSAAMMFDLGNAQDPGSRRDQQDAFAFSDPSDERFILHGGILAVLADGIGGLQDGAAASRTASSAFLGAYCAKVPSEPIADALERSLLAANDAVCTRAPGGGTTLVAAAVEATHLHWISAGDSALLLCRRGDLSTLTNAHIYARELEVCVANDGMPLSQALAHPDRDCLTSYVGVPRIAEIDRSAAPFGIEPGDRVLLATDGLYKTLDFGEIALAIGGSSQDSCERLVKNALEKGRQDQDNITVLMFTACPVARPAASPEPASTREFPKPPSSRFERWMFWRKQR